MKGVRKEHLQNKDKEYDLSASKCKVQIPIDFEFSRLDFLLDSINFNEVGNVNHINSTFLGLPQPLKGGICRIISIWNLLRAYELYLATFSCIFIIIYASITVR